jgi:hypothetical protein
VEHWLNGDKVVEYDLGTPDFQRQLAASAAATGTRGGPLWGKKFKTALLIMDDGEEVEFRNLRIRPIYNAAPATPATPTAARR